MWCWHHLLPLWDQYHWQCAPFIEPAIDWHRCHIVDCCRVWQLRAPRDALEQRLIDNGNGGGDDTVVGNVIVVAHRSGDDLDRHGLNIG